MNIEEYFSHKWVKSYIRRMSYQKVRFYRYGWWKGNLEHFGFSVHYELGRVKDGNFQGYLREDELEGLRVYLDDKFRQKDFVIKVLGDLAKVIETDFENYLRFIRNLPTDYSKHTDKELVDFLHQTYIADEPLSKDTWVLFDGVEIPLISATLKFLESKDLSTEIASDYLLKLSRPTKPTPLDKERISLLSSALLEGDFLAVALKQHTEEYGYMPMYDMDYKPYTFEYFEKKCQEIKRFLKPKEIDQEIASINTRYEKNKHENEEIISKFKGDNTITCLLKFFSDYSSLKDWKPYVRDKGSYYYRYLYQEVAKRINLSLHLTLFMSMEELDNVLLYKGNVADKILEQRSTNSVYFSCDNEIVCRCDPYILDKVDDLIKLDENVQEMKGTKVFGGLVKGMVSLILSNEDFHKFKKGQILVTSATRPDFVPLMKKAVAVVTDEGGILSHAAIVSRELKVPCVVGTKIATKVLKDGDLVEVNANIGTVRIIKKTSG